MGRPSKYPQELRERAVRSVKAAGGIQRKLKRMAAVMAVSVGVMGGSFAVAQPASAATICTFGSGVMQLVHTGSVPAVGEIYQVFGSLNTSGCETAIMDVVAVPALNAIVSTPSSCNVTLPEPVTSGIIGCYGLEGYSGYSETYGQTFTLTLEAVGTAVGQTVPTTFSRSCHLALPASLTYVQCSI